MNNVLRQFLHLPLAVAHFETLARISRSNFRNVLKPLQNLSDCIERNRRMQVAEKGFEWYIFDGTTLTFYVSALPVIEKCKQIAYEYLELATIDFSAINFVVGLPEV